MGQKRNNKQQIHLVELHDWINLNRWFAAFASRSASISKPQALQTSGWSPLGSSQGFTLLPPLGTPNVKDSAPICETQTTVGFEGLRTNFYKGSRITSQNFPSPNNQEFCAQRGGGVFCFLNFLRFMANKSRFTYILVLHHMLISYLSEFWGCRSVLHKTSGLYNFT